MGETKLQTGLLLAFEGIDGSGKSTQAMQIAVMLRRAGLTVSLTREPTRGRYGQELRRSASEGRLPADRELELFLLDRAEHVRTTIGPGLAAGEVVITDRYYFSTLAYQGARGFDRAKLLADNEAIAPPPDLLVILDVPVNVALDRIRRGRADQTSTFERAEMLTACRDIYLEIAASVPYGRVVDGMQEQTRITKQILALLFDGPLSHRLEERFGPGGAAEARFRLLGE